jgi:Carboxypeptidase regulatory-like domain
MDRAGFVRCTTDRPRRRTSLLPLLLLFALIAATMTAGSALAAPAARANGTLTVSITDAVTAAPISVVVAIYPWDTDNVAPLTYDVTIPGSQSFSLPAGSYELLAYDDYHYYVTQWWDQEPWWHKSDAIVVKNGQDTTCSVRMQPGGHVQGVVTDTAGNPLSGIIVDVEPYSPHLDSGGESTTDVDGRYDVGGLATGAYTVEAQDLSQEMHYLYQFYPDQRSFVTAQQFAVVAGQVTAGPTVVMKAAATISGALTTHAGVVPHDVDCCVDRRNDDGTWHREYGGACCNNDKTWQLGQLPPGHYRLWFQWDFGTHAPNLPQYYQGTYWVDQAYQFDLTEGEHLTGMDAVIWGDDQSPTTLAPAAGACRRGAVASLPFEVKDTGRHGPRAAVSIVVKTRTGKVVKVIRMAHSPVNHLHLCRYLCHLPKGRYRFCVYAIDSGGNRQKRIASNWLTVK